MADPRAAEAAPAPLLQRLFSSLRLLIAACIAAPILGVALLLLLAYYTERHHEHRSNEMRLRAIQWTMERHAEEHDGVYPDGFGYLIFTGALSPELLVSPYEPGDTIDEHDWGGFWTPPFDPSIDAFLEEESSYEVLRWGQPAGQDPGKLLASERPRRSRSRVGVVFEDGEPRTIPRAEALRVIRASGHEPVWADEP